MVDRVTTSARRLVEPRKSRVFGKVRKNKFRRYRRRNSKTRYYSRLKTLRLQRKTEEVAERLSKIVTDMDWSAQLLASSRDVAAWHQAEQVAYWKSRALTLEMENRMLQIHIRDFYARQVHEYEEYAKHPPVEQQPPVQDKGDEVGNETARPKQLESARKAREDMKSLYGDMAPQIIGMETAVQLNYDLHATQDSPRFWPNIAFRI